MKPLKRNFYERSTLEVAKDLLGKVLHRRMNGNILKGKIVETEGYLQDDKACHASRGKTKRNRQMFGPPGYAYVYFTYGMHYCFNAVTRPEGVGEAVLIRAVEPLEGVELMEKNRGREEHVTDGPAKLCQAFEIDKEQNGSDLTKGDFVILDSEETPEIKKAKRIGIKENAHKLWRFHTGSDFVSKK